MLVAQPLKKLMTFVAIAFLSTATAGCQETQNSNQEQKQSTSEKTLRKSETKKSDTTKKPTLVELLSDAEAALEANKIDDAKASATAAQSLSKTNYRAKMEIARILFGCGAMKESAAVYDEVVEGIPDAKPQLWQRGLALYYAEEFEKGVDQFESHQTYNSQDVENSVWHLLCKAKVTSLAEAREEMIKIERDSRIPMKQVFEMFAGTGSPEAVLKACSYDPKKVMANSEIYHGLLYVGLFHEMMGDQEASNKSMTEALKFKPRIQGLMGHVAEGHLRARKAYPGE